METPSSSSSSSTTRFINRSQTLAAPNNTPNSVPISRRIEDSSEKGGSKSRQRATKQHQDRSAMVDITNDSPIVGVATGGLETPSSAASKQRTIIRAKNNTPGSGETLLRCQVKTLLQKVEEEAVISKISLESRPFLHLQGFVNSPMRLLAPTPANTPQVLNLYEDASVAVDNGLASMNASPVIQDQMISLVVDGNFDGKIQESIESDINLISRSLLLDFSEKTECPSVVTEDSKEKSCLVEEDDSSVWSIQVNADEDDDEECDDGGLVDELCQEMSKIDVNNNEKKGMSELTTGRHTRFLYNSDDDDEIVEQLLCFKGLPTPKGKHIRFANDEEEN